MLFSSMIFIFLFLPIVCVLYFIIPNITYKNIILLISSLIFYAWGEPVYVLLMLCSIAFNYALAFFVAPKKSETKGNKLFLIIAVVVNISLLLVFKYTGFFVSNINSIFSASFSIPKIVLPIGISFYTFQILSYVIDVYRGNVIVQKNILNLGCYIALFPQLIAGPIVRYIDVEKELKDRKTSSYDFLCGLKQFMLGLGSKVIIANNMAAIADGIFNDIANADTASFWIASFAYSFQIFFDFSGYSRMAIGLGRIFGFHFSENFNYPYVATSITDFWRRWHISLSTWFRDYVYIPLGGSRCTKFRMSINILITWLLTGFWHGASWNFVIWGAYYAILLLVEKLFLGEFLKKVPKIFLHIITLFIVNIAWVIFRIENFNDLFIVIKGMFVSTGFTFFDFSMEHADEFAKMIFFVPAVIFSIPFFKLNDEEKLQKINKKSIVELVLAFLVFCISIFMLIASTYNPFIYFRF